MTGAGLEAPRAWDATVGWFLLVHFFLSFAQGVFAPLLPEVMEDLDLSFASAGLLGTALGAARFCVTLPAGLLAERLGAARIVHAGIGALLAGSLLSALAPSLAAMLAARALVGAGSGVMVVVALLYLMRRAPAATRTRLGNAYELAVMVGTATSALLAGGIASRLGWRWGYGASTLAVIIGWFVAASRVLPKAAGVIAAGGPAAVSLPATGRPAARGGLLPIYLLAFSLSVGWAGATSALLPLYGGRHLGLTPGALGRTLALAYAIEIALLLPVGWASDRFGRLRVLLPGVLVMLVGIVLVPLAGSAGLFGVACTLVVSGMAVWIIPPTILAERLGSGFRGRAVGAYRFAADLGFILSPAAVGWMIGRAGFGAAAWTMAAVFLVSIAVTLGAHRYPRALAAKDAG